VGRNESYFNDYLGHAQEFVSSIKYGFLYQGQWYSWQHKRRGSRSIHLKPSLLINFIENHDQVANSGKSSRLRSLTHPGAYRAVTALLLLAPQTPLLFQGQEFGATTPFYYFSDLSKELAMKVYNGRIQYTAQFASFSDPEVKAQMPFPQAEETFSHSKLNWAEKEKYPFIYQLYKDLIALRKTDSVFSNLSDCIIEGEVLNENAFLLRYSKGENERLLLFNFGIDLLLEPCPLPLYAPPPDHHWDIFWSSEDVAYGGLGRRPYKIEGNGYLSGSSALILYPKGD
jgi:maltooligosyltrehalose trehalohydrolase